MLTLEQLAARMAQPREKEVELLAAAERAHGLVFAEELRAWVRAFERYELETIEPAYTELRTPDGAIRLRTVVEVEDGSRIAGLVGLFTGASIIGQQDELSFLAAWAPGEAGASRVYHFHPEDWGLWPTDPSLVVRLYRLLQEDKDLLRARRFQGEEGARAQAEVDALRAHAEDHALDPRLDPERLFPRTAWLVHLFLGHGGDWKAELARAGTIADWLAERELVSGWPQLALYWLWSHALLGNYTELDEALALTQKTTSALVGESRELVSLLQEGRDLRIGMRNAQVLEAFREQFQDEAPAEVLGSGARERRDARERSTLAASDEEHRLQSTLRGIATRDEKVAEALELLALLEEGGSLRQATLQAKKGMSIAEAVERFVQVVDGRFRSLLLVKIRKAARWPDSSPHATHGLLVAFAKVAKSFDELEGIVRASGTGNFGARRLAELHRAWGRFDTPASTQRLVEAARAYVAELESWEPKMPPEALLQLLSRDVGDTHQLMAEVLEKASLSGANAAVALAVAEAAGRLRSRAAVPGLLRAVERELGRIDDGTRARVVSALVLAAGGEAAAPLRRMVDERIARWLGEPDREVAYPYYHKEIAVLFSGLLPLEPNDPALLAKAREMLEAFLVELGPERRPRKDVIYAVAALLRGIGHGRSRALADAVEPLGQLRFLESRATEGLREMLTKLALEVRARL